MIIKHLLFGYGKVTISILVQAQKMVYREIFINEVDVGLSYVDKDFSLPMTLSLSNKNGDEIFTCAPAELQWWITGFNPQYKNVNAEELSATVTIDFSQRKPMFDDSVDKYSDDRRWSFDKQKYTATLTY